MAELEPPYPLIRKGLFQGEVIPFLGSGASLQPSCPVWDLCVDTSILKAKPGMCYLRAKCDGYSPPASIGLPRASELACHLARLCNFPPDESPELARVAQYVDLISGRDALDHELRLIFNRDYQPSAVHHLLANIDAPLLIVTTNYDDLIERAFEVRKREYEVVVHTTDPKLGGYLLWIPYGEINPVPVVPNKLDLDLSERTVIYKMHGAVDRTKNGNDQYVITEDDYINFLSRMTKRKVIPSIFAEPFQSRHFLFIGHGLQDWNLRIVLKRLDEIGPGKSVRQLVSWAIQYEPSPIERRFWQQRGVEVFNKRIEEFVEQLSAAS